MLIGSFYSGGCPKRRPAPLSQFLFFQAWLGPGLGGPILCFPSPVSSWQRAAPGKPSVLLHPGSSSATWVHQEPRAQGTLLPTVRERGVGPFILDEEKRGFPTQFTRGVHLAVIRLCSADGKLGWDPSSFLVSILGWNLEKEVVKK